MLRYRCLLALACLSTTAAARPPDPLAAAQAALDAGRYDEVAALTARVESRQRSTADALAGEALRKTGRFADARRLLEATLQRDPAALAARLQLGLVYRSTGQRDLERAAWNRFFDDYEQGHVDKKSAFELMFVADAARFLGSTKDANDVFRDAVDADPKGAAGARANVEWAALFLEKYDAGHAEVCLDEALKVRPEDADAHALMARVKLEQGDVAPAERELAAALRANPRHVGALATRATILLEDERRADAITAAGQALRVDPESLEARVVVGAARLLGDDAAGFAAERDHVNTVGGPARVAEFLHGVAEFLVQQHRYVEANQLEKDAIHADAKNAVAQAALGTNLLRLGHDAAGLEALRAAWDGDHYNVRTYNLLSLFEDVIPKAYELVEGTPFRFRVPSKEKALLMRYARPLVAREYAELVARYGFTPQGPLTIELFADPQHYAVRTVGLPGLEALGVTFGNVITGMSPATGRFNWGMMLWHEVAHIFALQQSRYRVPRWFTEGLSEYETARHQPEWTRRTHAELYHALAAGQLSSVTQLNGGFTRARDVSHIVVAYHQAAETVAFLVRRWGFGAAVAALRHFAAGKDTAEVIPLVTKLDVAAFDRAFQDDLRQRLKPYEGTFFVRNSDFSDIDALKEQIAAHPDDGRAKGLYALALAKAHRGEEAQKIVDEAQKNAAIPAKELLLAGAEVLLLHKDRSGAKKLLEALLAEGGDGYDARLLLGQIAVAENNVPEAELQLGRAKQFDAEQAQPYVELAKLYLKTREDDALRELEAAARLEVMDGAVPKKLVEMHAAKGHWQKVIELAPLALYIEPYDAALHLRWARALVELGRGKEAVAELAAVDECEPTDAQKAELKELRARIR
jgi:predicted Zn-dependent protease